MTTSKADEVALTGPERPGGQGLDPSQEESGDRAIQMILTDPVVGPQTAFVATHRNGAYEVWAPRGMIRFQRSRGDDGGYQFDVIETVGRNPIEADDPRAIATIEEELEAARRSGNPTDAPGRTFIEPEHLTYPFPYERIAQLFDSPNGPDLVVNPKSYAYGRQPGQHGTLDVVQSRAPLTFSGPGVMPGNSDTAVRNIDIAPTIARLMGFPLIVGLDATGRSSSEVYLRRQDGRPIVELLDLDGNGDLRTKPERVYLLNPDGLSHTELRWTLEHNPDAIPNLRRLIERGHSFRYGSTVTFPSITWPSHNTIGTGCWSGHHDIVNPTYYLREAREVVTPQGQMFDTAKYLGEGVETLYEAFHRVHGPWAGVSGAFTASIHEPCTRGADHSVLEHRVIGDRNRLKALTRESEADIDPRWQAGSHEQIHNEAIVDSRGIAQAVLLFSEDDHPPPIFTYHNFLLTDSTGHDFGPHSDGFRAALEEVDRHVGRILRTLEERGMFDSTLFVISADHGMAATRTELAADPAALLPKKGMKAVVTSPLIYLLDMAVEVKHARDGRTATITVLANDPDESGEQPPAAGAKVTLSDPGGGVLARAKTDSYGVAGIPLPSDVPPDDLVLAVQHEDFNARHVRLDGSSVVVDLQELLYGEAGDRGA